MKTILLLTIWLISNQIIAQYTISSFTMNTIDVTTNDIISSEYRQEIYNISFKDHLFIHNIIDATTNEVENSQVYKIIDITENDGITMFTTESGLSGNQYNFILTMEDDEISLFQYFDENEIIQFKGSSSLFKTFNQD